MKGSYLVPKYSISHQIWRALYPLLIFLGISFSTSLIASIIATSLVDFYNEIDRIEALEVFIFENANYFSLITIGVSSFIFLLMWRKMRVNAPAYEKSNLNALAIIFTVAMSVGLNYVIIAFSELTNLIILFPSFEQIAEILLSGSFAVRVVNAGIAAPIVEELLHRGIVLNRLLSWMPKWVAVLIGSALFGLLHFNLLQGLLAFGLGIVFSLLYLRYRNLWIPIIAHAANNLANVILLEVLNTFEVELNLWIFLISSASIAAVSAILIIKCTPVAVLVKESNNDVEKAQAPHSEG